MSRDEYGAKYEYFRLKLAKQWNLPYQAWFATRLIMEVYLPLGLTIGSRLLDAGCNIGDTGYYSRWLGVAVTGIDLNSVALKHGKNISRPSLGQTFIEGDVSMLPFENGYFDCIVSQDLLEHMSNVSMAEQAFKEMARVCKGKKMLHKVTVREDKDWIDSDPTHHIKENANWWKDFFAENGWKTISPTTRLMPVKNPNTLIGLGAMHGYFLLERSDSVTLVK